jgi:FixJ family two-component response regulator
MNELYKMQQQNEQLQKRVEFLQKRERELLDTVMKSSNGQRQQPAPYR